MHSIRISTVALLAALAITTPTLAASIRLLDSDSAVKVNLNDGDGINANVNLGDTDVNANVDAGDVVGNNDGDNTPAKVTIGNSGNGSTPANVSVTGSPLSSGSTRVNVNTGTLAPDATGGLVNDGTTNADVTLGGSEGNLLDDLLGGTTSGNANVRIGNTIPLNGADAGASTADISLNASPLAGGGNGDILGGLDDVASTVADINLLQDLFGGEIDFGGGGTGGTGGGSGAGNGVDDGGSGSTGTGTGGTGTGAGGTGSNGPIVGVGAGGSLSNGGTQVASIDGSAGGRCLTPSTAQQRRLINHDDYSQADLQAYAKAGNLQVVSLGVCGSARGSLLRRAAADSDVSDLRKFLARSPTMMGALAQSGKKQTDVVGADLKGNVLMVYVL